MTTENKTIDVHFIDLYAEDENDELSTISEHSTIGLSFQISRAEYADIRKVQKALLATQKTQGASFRYLHVCVSWEIDDAPNLMMNGIEFHPRNSELEISAYGIDLNIYHYGERSCKVKADLTTYLKDLFPDIDYPKEITSWDELAGELSGHITKEISVRITGDFTMQYPMLASPELEEGCNLKELWRFRYLAFQYEEAPADEEADMYALEFLQVYRGSDPELVLRVSEVDAEGHISVHNTVYSTEKVELLKTEQDSVEILIHTYDSEKKGGSNGMER
ncbi:MAG: hypothetical protein IJB89_02855 [Akkermansia sp.]|nr:hypothetical protein [Akkermansia sp.]